MEGASEGAEQRPGVSPGQGGGVHLMERGRGRGVVPGEDALSHITKCME